MENLLKKALIIIYVVLLATLFFAATYSFIKN